MALLAICDQTSSKHKICSKNVLNTVGTSFESLKCILFEKINFFKFSHFFMPFWNQNGIHRNTKKQNQLIPFWLQKGTKKCGKLKILNFLKTMEFKLSKDVPTVFKTFLEQILCFGEVWSTLAKSAILAIFGEN